MKFTLTFSIFFCYEMSRIFVTHFVGQPTLNWLAKVLLCRDGESGNNEAERAHIIIEKIDAVGDRLICKKSRFSSFFFSRGFCRSLATSRRQLDLHFTSAIYAFINGKIKHRVAASSDARRGARGDRIR